MKEYSLNTEITFGKHYGSEIKKIIELDPGYIEWAIVNLEHFYLDATSISLLQNKITVSEISLSINQRKMEEDNKTQSFTSHSQWDCYDDCDSVYSNPYYNDNLDMDQQSQEFWDSL